MFFNSLGWSRGSSIFSDAFSNNTSIYLTWFVQLYGLLLILSYIYFHNNFPLTNRKPRNQTAIDHSFIWPVSFNQWAMWTGGLLDTSHTYWPRNKNHVHNLYFIFLKLTLILRPDQGDEQGGGGGGGQERDPLVGRHHQAACGQIAGAWGAGVVHPPPGEHHGAQSVHTAL